MAKNIILIEDDPAIIDIYKIMIEKAGFNVEVFSSGEEFIRKIDDMKHGDEKVPDLVLLDLILPDITGEEVLVKLRQETATKNIKVFILSNKEIAPENVAAIKAQKFIIKANTSPTKLIEIIKSELT